jgi:hypothetical protein
MESESKSINVDKPFLSQQAFRDFLKLPSEEPVSKIGLHDLLDVAKVLIRHELNCCGCSEKELIGYRIEYQISKEKSQETGEIYSVQWSQIPQSEKRTEDENKISEDQPEVLNDKKNSPISSEFMGKLALRFNEVSSTLEGARVIASRADFRTFRSYDCREGCDWYNGILYKRMFCNEQPSDWILDGWKKVLCGGIEPDIKPIDL